MNLNRMKRLERMVALAFMDIDLGEQPTIMAEFGAMYGPEGTQRAERRDARSMRLREVTRAPRSQDADCPAFYWEPVAYLAVLADKF